MRLAVLMGAVALAAGGQTDSRGEALYRRLAADFERSATLLEDTGAEAYVDALAARLAARAAVSSAFKVKLLEDPQPRAVVLPGGSLYVSCGLIARSASEAELAGLLAHAIAHVAAGHATRPAAPGAGARISGHRTMPLILIGGSGGLCRRFSSGALVPFAQDAAAREQEADGLAVHYLLLSGYDSTGLVSIFDALRAPAAVAPAPVPGAIVSTAAFEAVRARLASRPVRRLPGPTLYRDEPPVLRRP